MVENGQFQAKGLSFQRVWSMMENPCGVVFYLLGEREEGIVREEADVPGKHGEEAALEEAGGDIGVVPIPIEGFGQFREGFGP